MVRTAPSPSRQRASTPAGPTAWRRCDRGAARGAAPEPRRAAPAARCRAPACRCPLPSAPRAGCSSKVCARIRIGDRVRGLAGLEAREARELAPPALAHGLGQLAVMVGEEQERRAARILLAHEDQRDLRAEQLQGDRGLQRLGIDAARSAGRRTGGCRSGRGSAGTARRRSAADRRWACRAACRCDRPRARPDRRSLRPGSAPACSAGAVGIVGVVAVALAGQQHMQDVMRIVVPLRIEAAPQMVRRVAVMLEHEMDMAAGLDGGAHLGRHLVEPVGLGDGVHGVEAQPVEAIFRSASRARSR